MQVAIVTGASSGIGFGCATKLAEQGMAVLGTGRDAERLGDLEKAVGDPERIATIAVDLTTDDGPRQIVAPCARLAPPFHGRDGGGIRSSSQNSIHE